MEGVTGLLTGGTNLEQYRNGGGTFRNLITQNSQKTWFDWTYGERDL